MSYTKPDPITEDDFPLVSLSQSGLHIESHKVAKKLDKVSLSPSTIASLEQCPAKWAFEKYVKPEILPEDKDTPGRRGSVFHDIMEEFFRIEPPQDRTTSELTRITKEVISEKYPDFKDNPEVIQWVKEAIQGYYKMGGKPQSVIVADTPKNKRSPDDPDETQKGLEIFVKGKLGDTIRSTLGYIDQVLDSSVGENKSVVVSDWKTGKMKIPETSFSPSRYGKNTVSTTKLKRGDDGFNEVRQQMIYTMLLEQQEVSVSSARLVYPVAGTVVNVDVDDEVIRLRIIETIEEADQLLEESIENNTFEYGPSFLCSWCPLSKVCPDALLKQFPKAWDAQAQQPDPEDLKPGVAFK